LKSAESEWRDVLAFAQDLLNRNAQARELVDVARYRRDAALKARGDLSARPWPEIEGWRLDDRLVADYRAAVRSAANGLALGTTLGSPVIHDLVGSSGYRSFDD
jgi:hypothetical protein